MYLEVSEWDAICHFKELATKLENCEYGGVVFTD